MYAYLHKYNDHHIYIGRFLHNPCGQAQATRCLTNPLLVSYDLSTTQVSSLLQVPCATTENMRHSTGLAYKTQL